jgi:hypothetical protein
LDRIALQNMIQPRQIIIIDQCMYACMII